MDVHGAVALITGGKRIGAAVAIELASRGADVGLVYRSSRDEAEATAESIRALGRRAVVLQADLRDADACARVVEQTASALGRLDVLVNVASLYQRKAFDALEVHDWDAQLAVDLRAAWLCAKAAVP